MLQGLFWSVLIPLIYRTGHHWVQLSSFCCSVSFPESPELSKVLQICQVLHIQERSCIINEHAQQNIINATLGEATCAADNEEEVSCISIR